MKILKIILFLFFYIIQLKVSKDLATWGFTGSKCKAAVFTVKDLVKWKNGLSRFKVF